MTKNITQGLTLNLLFLSIAFQFTFPFFLYDPFALLSLWHLPYPFAISFIPFVKSWKRKDIAVTSIFLIICAINLVLNFSEASVQSFGVYTLSLVPFGYALILREISLSPTVYISSISCWLIASVLQFVGLEDVTYLLVPRDDLIVAALQGSYKTQALSPEPSFAAGYIFFFIAILLIPDVLNWKLLNRHQQVYIVSVLVLLVFLNGSSSIFLDISLFASYYLLIAFLFSVKKISRRSIKLFVFLLGFVSLTMPVIMRLLPQFSLEASYLLRSITQQPQDFNLSTTQTNSFAFNFLRATYELGSWRQISNFFSIQIGLESIPFGNGLGSWKALSGTIMSGGFRQLSWVTSTFSFMPLIICEFSLVGLVFISCLLFRGISLKKLMESPVLSSLIVVCLTDLTFFTPKLTVSYWILLALIKKRTTQKSRKLYEQEVPQNLFVRN